MGSPVGAGSCVGGGGADEVVAVVVEVGGGAPCWLDEGAEPDMTPAEDTAVGGSYC